MPSEVAGHVSEQRRARIDSQVMILGVIRDKSGQRGLECADIKSGTRSAIAVYPPVGC